MVVVDNVAGDLVLCVSEYVAGAFVLVDLEDALYLSLHLPEGLADIQWWL